MDGAAVAIFHALEAMALAPVEVAAVAHAHPRLGTMEPHLAMMQAPGLLWRQVAVAHALADPLRLAMLALVDGLRRRRDRDAHGRHRRQGQDQSLHHSSPSTIEPAPSGAG
jgi:hypothetical protein